jgi:oxygen-independent coproporphyrinogen-3 oxidase
MKSMSPSAEQAHAPSSQNPARHLYVHLPFCAHRCGYCDFVTVSGREGGHASYVDAVLAELALERGVLAESLETVFVGGGTPTFTDSSALERLLDALPPADEVTVEANPETVTPELARLLLRGGVTRVSLGAQSFRPHLLAVLERRAGPDDVRRAAHDVLEAGFDNVSFDFLYGVPGQSVDDLERDLSEALALEPEHMSWYELEAKPGTRFTHAHGDELLRQADAMEGYYERVVDTLTAAGYRWYETANFCLGSARAGQRDLRARHNLAYWLGRDYLGLGIGAVSTVDGIRRRNRPGLAAYVRALGEGVRPPSECETIDRATRTRERLLLGLRLDEPLPLADVEDAFDHDAAGRLVAGGLVELLDGGSGLDVSLTRRGRFLAGGVSAELMALESS